MSSDQCSDRYRFWRMLFGLTAAIGILATTPSLLSQFGYLPPVDDHNWIVLLVVIFGMAIKTLAGDLASGNFEYHKYGYDFCIMTFGGVLSSFSLQLMADKDLYPGLKNFDCLRALKAVASNESSQRSIFFLLMLLLTCATMFLTARISDEIRRKAAHSSLLSVINFFVGSSMLSIYTIIIITKA